MKKALNWTWLGVGIAILLYLLPAIFNVNIYVSFFSGILQIWAIVFLACFGFNKCRKAPFKQRMLWISLACAVGFVIITNLFTSLVNIIAGSIEINNLCPAIIISTSSTALEIVLLILAYMLARSSVEGKQAFNKLRWNGRLAAFTAVTAAYLAYRVYINAAFAAMSLNMLSEGSNILSIAMFFASGSPYLTMIFRGALLFFIGAAALDKKTRGAYIIQGI